MSNAMAIGPTRELLYEARLKLATTPQPTRQNVSNLASFLAMQGEGLLTIGKITKNFDISAKLDGFSYVLRAIGVAGVAIAAAQVTVGVLAAAPAIAAAGLTGAAVGAGALFGGILLNKLVGDYVTATKDAVAKTLEFIGPDGALRMPSGQRINQMTSREAIAFANGNTWKNWSDEKILAFQISQNLGCFPMPRLQEAARNVFGHDVGPLTWADKSSLGHELTTVLANRAQRAAEGDACRGSAYGHR
jgi:hypothetical protein